MISQTWLVCPNCEDIITSEYRHDYRECKCGACSIDGGKDYLKVSYDPRLVGMPLTFSSLKEAQVEVAG